MGIFGWVYDFVLCLRKNRTALIQSIVPSLIWICQFQSLYLASQDALEVMGVTE